MVSGCYSTSGQAFLWGANTNSQLGKGDLLYDPAFEQSSSGPYLTSHLLQGLRSKHDGSAGHAAGPVAA